MTRIGVLGSCQASGYAASISALLPHAEVRHFYVNLTDAQDVLDFAKGSDAFLTQPLEDPQWGPLRTSQLELSNLVLIPHVLFTGFHPDLTEVPAWGSDHSALFGYHSTVVAACFCLGMPASRAEMLMNRFVFQQLGYLDEYKRASSFLVQSCQELGYDIGPLLETWSNHSAFMYTINHPSIRVLFDIAALGLVKCGVIGLDAASRLPPPELPSDDLGFVRWPIYQCVAEDLAVEETSSIGLGDDLVSIAEFAEKSYACYRDADQAALSAIPAVRQAINGLGRMRLR